MRWADRGWGGASELTTSNREAEGRRFEHQAGRDESSWYAPYRGQASLAVGARVGRSHEFNPSVSSFHLEYPVPEMHMHMSICSM